jgi:hypothetical protein
MHAVPAPSQLVDLNPVLPGPDPDPLGKTLDNDRVAIPLLVTPPLKLPASPLCQHSCRF